MERIAKMEFQSTSDSNNLMSGITLGKSNGSSEAHRIIHASYTHMLLGVYGRYVHVQDSVKNKELQRCNWEGTYCSREMLRCGVLNLK